jgi:hypothetical protein
MFYAYILAARTEYIVYKYLNTLPDIILHKCFYRPMLRRAVFFFSMRQLFSWPGASAFSLNPKVHHGVDVGPVGSKAVFSCR